MSAVVAGAEPAAPVERCALRLDCPPKPEYVAQVRGAIAVALAAWQVPSDAIDDIQLLATELLGNVCTHARSVTPVVSLNLTLSAPEIRCDVTDGSSAAPHLRTDADDEHGRGLHLVKLLADRWGFTRLGHAGKRVWFVYRLV